MSTGTEDFEKLRKLLKLKRYEQPPPGYFNNFSNLVINRIERGERGFQEVTLPWVANIFRFFQSSPVFSGLFGAALCALVIYGVAGAHHPSRIEGEPLASAASVTVDSGASAVELSASARPERSTDPMIGASVFNSPFAANNANPSARPVSFTPDSQ
jgi:hypothetical protein